MTRVITALDVGTIAEERRLLTLLKGAVRHYKIGLQLFTAHGRKAVDLVHRHGGKVFLDLKFLDIPQTVANAVREAQRLGVFSVSLHLWGGADMLRAAAAVSPRPRLWGVTVLTSMGEKDIQLINPGGRIAAMAESLARMGRRNGLDGIICSGREVAPLRKALKGSKLSFITPGIRPAASPSHDQRRVMTPAEAARLGVDYIVVGRPITAAPDPRRATRDILRSLEAA